MRRLVTLTILALALGLAASASASAQTVFVLRGHGWGHGVGMAQWGAYGFAKNGWTYERILAHYYQGTTLGPAPAERIRVLLAAGRGRVSISSPVPYFAVGAKGKVELPAGTVALGPDLTITVGGKERKLTSPVRFEPGKEPLSFDRAYRGALVVHLVDGSLSVVNDLKLDHYVYAIVPHEMPATWDIEALKVQAVAARTFAIVSTKPGTYYDFEHNHVAQAYEGIEEEHPRATSAVDATSGQIVLYAGKPAWTFYSSSSGGRTATLTESLGGGQDYPYLVSVEDPYDTLSPDHDWIVRLTARELASRLGLPRPPRRLRAKTGPSGRVTALVGKGPGWTKEVPGGSRLRSILGVRSTLFAIAKEPSVAPSPAR
jgi:stage II sporulation protein D